MNDDDLKNLAKKYGSLNYKRPQKHMIEFAEELMFCAEQDTKASRLLFKNRLFSLSMFHLQQSVEKLAKAYLISYGVVDEQDLKRIGHDSPMTFVEIAEVMSDFIPIIKDAYPGIETDYAKLANIVTEVKAVKSSDERPHELVVLPYDQIVGMLGRYDTFVEETNANVMKFLDLIVSIVTDKVDRQTRDQLNQTIRSSVGMMKDIMVLFVLAAVTFPHEQCTRYPGLSFKPRDYTRDVGIVKAIPLLLDRSDKVRLSLERYYALLKSSIISPG